MRGLCICVLLALVCATVQAQFEDPWDLFNNDYDSVYDSETFDEPAEIKSDENVDTNDKVVQNDIDTFREENDAAEESDDGDNLDDYQFEDNRSKNVEKLSEETKIDENILPRYHNVESFDDDKDIPEKNDDVIEDENPEIPEQVDENDSKNLADDYALLWGDAQEAQALEKIKEDELRVLDETKSILEEEAIENSDFEASNVAVNDNDANSVLQETKNILAGIDNDFDNGDGNKEVHSEDSNDDIADIETQDQEVQKEDIDVPNYDLSDDIKKIAEDMDTYSDIEDDNKETQGENVGDADEHKEIQIPQENIVAPDDSVEDNINKEELSPEKDSEDKENVSSEEDSVDKAYADLNADLDQLFDTLDKLSNDDDKNDIENEKEVDENKSKDELDEQRLHDALVMDPLDYEEKYGRPFREGLTLQMRNENNYEDDLDGVEDESYFDDWFTDNNKTTESEPVAYANDAFVAKETNISITNEDEPLNDKITDYAEFEENDTTEAKIDVDELTSAELSDLMEQFTELHKEELNTELEDFDKHIAPIYMTLSVDEPTMVTSPNYPDPYPTNNIIDWVFQGEGVGIELNITDFAVNGAVGDYLLIKPGGIDASGKDGLVFSYRLNSVRRYRFVDVDRMFVRFEAKSGMAFFQGFTFSVKMISPKSEEQEPPIPAPEPVLTPPTETLTLNLGGVTLPQFEGIQEFFRVIIADMATEYIDSNNIDQGLNTTFEITQITRTIPCNMHWPESESCVEVTFGVPLTLEEGADPRLTTEDLEDMWRTYIRRDPFALRLQRLGITEFEMPNERSILAVWLVIAAGVFISMAMLGFALRRFSCFEDYTRMKAYSDTDSLHNEKRTLDLYPTPHQTLPPLYADAEYKWVEEDSTRVDMGGFGNKNFSSDMYDFDSDEDVITPRDRVGTKGQNYFDA